MSDQQWLPGGSLKGRTAIVTGGAGSFGKIICHALARAGASVVVNDMGTGYSGHGASASPAQDLAREICALGYTAIPDTHSVLDAQKIVDNALRSFGRVDILINNAGINRYGKFEDYSTKDLRDVLETNTLGPLLLCHAVWPIFLSQGYGRIVNIASSSVLGMADYAPYITSKGGLVSLTKALAAEVGDKDIKVNVVGPISASRMALAALTEEKARKDFEDAWPPAGNVAIILALTTDSCNFNGEFFSTGGYRVHRIVFGMLPGLEGVDSAMTILDKQSQMMSRDQKVVEQRTTEESIAWVMDRASLA